MAAVRHGLGARSPPPEQLRHHKLVAGADLTAAQGSPACGMSTVVVSSGLTCASRILLDVVALP
jgi:hypothetical protein